MSREQSKTNEHVPFPESYLMTASPIGTHENFSHRITSPRMPEIKPERLHSITTELELKPLPRPTDEMSEASSVYFMPPTPMGSGTPTSIRTRKRDRDERQVQIKKALQSFTIEPLRKVARLFEIPSKSSRAALESDLIDHYANSGKAPADITLEIVGIVNDGIPAPDLDDSSDDLTHLDASPVRTELPIKEDGGFKVEAKEFMKSQRDDKMETLKFMQEENDRQHKRQQEENDRHHTRYLELRREEREYETERRREDREEEARRRREDRNSDFAYMEKFVDKQLLMIKSTIVPNVPERAPEPPSDHKSPDRRSSRKYRKKN